MERKKKALISINLKKGIGLELGPLYSPIVLKDEANIHYADHMSTGELRKKYDGHPFEVSTIVDIDYVIDGRTLTDALENKKFNYVVASHVIEHLPDVIGWLNEIYSILKPGGILSLVIPDKRYSFDISRDVSSPAELIGAHLDRIKESTSAMVYESAAEYKDISPVKAWSGKALRFPEPGEWRLNEAMRLVKIHKETNEYVDAHCYVFTPYSFFSCVKRLIEHGLFDFEVESFCDTGVNELEFYISLRKPRGLPNKKRQLASIPKIKRPLTTYEMEKKIIKLENEINLVKNSRSWRITRPLRKINKIL